MVDEENLYGTETYSGMNICFAKAIKWTGNTGGQGGQVGGGGGRVLYNLIQWFRAKKKSAWLILTVKSLWRVWCVCVYI